MKTDVIIVGGGLNGSTLALALAHAGLRSVMIDALPVKIRKNPKFDGRSYALANASSRLMQALGVWDALRADAQPMLEIKVTDGKAGQGPSSFWMHFDHAEIEEGPMGYMVQDRHLRYVLLDAVKSNDKITHIAGHRVVAQNVDANTAQVTLDNGDIIHGALIVGSDGRGSGTAQTAGIKRIAWGYDQTALVCAVEHEKPHNGIAHQFFMPTGPLAILPLTGNRSSIVWSETTVNATKINAMSDVDYLTHLRPAFGSFLGDINLTGDRFCYPLGLSLATEMIADRVALIGDAAHGVHPIAGQGLNAGLRDVAALAEVLSDARQRGLDIGSPINLGEYQQWRRFDNTTLAIATDSFNRLFSNDNSLLRMTRDLGMGLVNKLPSLRRGFIREAAGLTGDLPKLMQGKAL